MSRELEQRMAVAIVAEIERQADAWMGPPLVLERLGHREYVIDGPLDIEALARAVVAAIFRAMPFLQTPGPEGQVNDRRTGKDRREGKDRRRNED